MKVTCICSKGLWESLTTDWNYLNFSESFELTAVILDPANNNVEGLVDACKSADVIGWWWSSESTHIYYDLIVNNKELNIIFSNDDTKRHVFVSETHHRPYVLNTIEPFFHRIYSPHLNFVPDGDPRKVRWLPYCFPGLTVREFENLMTKSVSPQVDLVFPFKVYYIGDRINRLSKIINLLKDMKIDFRYGTYLSELSDDYEYSTNYYNIMASAKAVLNLSIWRDLNQRLFETNALGTNLITEYQNDMGVLDFDRSNTFFFKSDLSNFQDNVMKAVENKPNPNTKIDIRNKHLPIHRYAKFFSELTSTKISVKPYAQQNLIPSGERKKISYVCLSKDYELTESEVDLRAMQCCLYNRIPSCLNLDAAYSHLQSFVANADKNFDMMEIMPEILYMILPFSDENEIVKFTTFNKVAELRNQSLKRFSNTKIQDLAGFIRNYIKASPDIKTLRQMVLNKFQSSDICFS